VVLFVDRGLKRSQQMFSDLNKYAVRPSNSIGILYDHRDPLSEVTRKIIQEIDVFRDRIELEKTSMSNRSSKLFTLSSLYGANKVFLGKTKRNHSISKEEEELAIAFWKRLSESMPYWKDVKTGKIKTSELRRDYVHAHGVILQSLGHVGNALIALHPKHWADKLKHLSEIDWRRKNKELWEGRAMAGGRMVALHPNVLLSAAAIKATLGLSISAEEQKFEKLHAKKEQWATSQ